MEHHALAVDIGGGELHDLGDAQAGGIDRDEDGAHSEIGDGLQEPHDLVAREHGGQRVLFAWQWNLLGDILQPERGAIEEPQGAHDRDDRRRP